jgi:hypothetical protein
MKVIDPGHYYELNVLDGDLPLPAYLRFVKREGPGYPGNKGQYPGTTCQEVLRACVDRLEYVNKQQPSHYTQEARSLIKDAIYNLEMRAAERHGRPYPGWDEATHGKCCPKCNHVGCEGRCH